MHEKTPLDGPPLASPLVGLWIAQCDLGDWAVIKKLPAKLIAVPNLVLHLPSLLD